MPELTVEEMAAKLRGERFTRTELPAQTLGDPIADTPMVVTLDQVRPYDLNPRITRNPRYDELKASIRERGLDAPLAITRRPGEASYILCNGGNTRLAILQELWTQTRDERFFRIPSFFRPWPSRGDIVALTGHLTENELRGDLSFVERALGVAKARELYELEAKKPLSQRELAQRLTADGYPITQPHISKMEDAIRHLLPAIPAILYAGLSKHQVERLTALRRAGARVWDRRAAGAQLAVEFSALFQDVLSRFDADPDGFSPQRVQDELLMQMSRELRDDYDTLALEIIDAEDGRDAISRDPASQPPINPPFTIVDRPKPVVDASALRARADAERRPKAAPPARSAGQHEHSRGQSSEPDFSIESDPPVDEEPDLDDDTLQSRNTAERRNPRTITEAGATDEETLPDVWHIERSLDTPQRLRVHIAQLISEIAREVSLTDQIRTVNDGVGYALINSQSKQLQLSRFQLATLMLLDALSAPYTRHAGAIGGAQVSRDLCDLGPLLQGSRAARAADMPRLSDAGLARLFRSIRLSRRLLDLESAGASPSAGNPSEAS